MSNIPWSDKDLYSPVLDADQLLAINSTTGLNNRLTGLSLKTYVQTPLLNDVDAAGNNITGLGAITFDDTSTSIGQSGSNLLYDVVLNGLHTLRVDGLVEYSFSATQMDCKNNNVNNIAIAFATEFQVVNPAGQNPRLLSNSTSQSLEIVGNVGLGLSEPQALFTVQGGTILQNAQDATIVGQVTNATLNNVTGLAVSGKFAYVVTAESTSQFSIIDITDETSPEILGTVSDISSMRFSDDIVVSGQFAYVTSSTTGSITVVDISTPDSPTIVSTFTDSNLEGITALYISGKFIYAGSGSASNTFSVIDASNPNSLRIVGTLTDFQFNTITGIFVNKNFAYITAALGSTFSVIDVSDPETPVKTGSVQDAVNLNGLFDLYVSGRYAYVACADDNSIRVIDVSNPASPAIVGGVKDDTNLAGARTIYVAGTYLYVGTQDNNSLEIYDISEPIDPVFVGRIQDNTNLSSIRNISASGTFVYVTAGSSDNFVIIDVTGTQIPTANIGTIETNTINVAENVIIGNNLFTDTINIGFGGIKSDGEVSFANDTITTIKGNVGIGFNDPVSILHVRESTAFTDAAAGLTIENAGSGDASLHFVLSGAQTWTMGVDDSDADSFKIAVGDALETNTALTIDTSGTITMGNLLVDQLEIANQGSGANPILLSNSPSQDLSLTGRLGIGTLTPIAPLSLKNNSLLGITIINTINGASDEGTGVISYTDDGAATSSGDRLGFYLMGGATDGSGTLQNTAGMQAFASENFSGSAAGSELEFLVTPNGTTTRIEAMLIDNAGNVGIGIDVIAARLCIFEDSSEEASAGILVENDGLGDAVIHFSITATDWSAGINNDVSNNYEISNDLNLDTNVRLALTTTGKAGFNKSDPVSTVHIFENNTEAGSGGGLTIEQDGSGDAVLHFVLSGTRDWTIGIDNTDSDKFKISNNVTLNTDAFLTIDTISGDVGIGTVIPAAKFHIFEDNSNVNSAGLLIQQDGAGDALTQYEVDSGRRWVVGIDNSDDDKFKIASTINLDSDARLTIDTAGNIGIGIIDPVSPLHVFESTANETNAGITVENGSTGDAVIHYIADGVNWSAGLNNDTSNSFEISNSLDLDGNVRLALLTGGNAGFNKSDPVSTVHIFENTTNSSDTAGLTIENAGAGNALLHFVESEPAISNWTMGIAHNLDNRFFIANDTEFSTDSYFTILENGRIGMGALVPLSSLHILEDSTETILAGVTIQNNGTGDAVLHYDTNVVDWSSGIDQSDSDTFKISNSLDLGTNTFFTIQTTGEVTMGNVTMNDITVDQITFENQGSGGNPILFSNSANQDLSLTGNLGIGTTISAVSLDVIGSIQNTDTYIFSDGTTQPYGATPNGFNWHISTLVFNQLLALTGSGLSTQDVCFKPDGLRMYVVENKDTEESIRVFTLTIPWDITTAIEGTAFDLTGQTDQPMAIFFKPDGTQFWVLSNQSPQSVLQYDVSTPWDLSTATFNSVEVDISANDDNTQGLFFRYDGLKMYVVGIENTRIYEYDLDAPWDISTASLLDTFNVTGQDTQPTNVAFDPTGKKMYVIGITNDNVYEYDLGIPWRIDTPNVTFVNSFSLANEDGAPTGIFFKPDATKLFMSGNDNDEIYEYDLGIVVLGNEGIGTDTPETTLHVVNDTTTATNEIGIQIEQMGTGDAILQFRLTGSQRWVMGCDQSDNRSFRIAQTEDLDTDVALKIDRDTLNIGIGGITSPNSGLQIGSSLAFKRVFITTSTYNENEDSIIGVDTNSNAVTITLSTASADADGRMLIIKDEGRNAASSNITINPNGRTIDGVAGNKVIAIDGTVLRLYSDGTNWETS